MNWRTFLTAIAPTALQNEWGQKLLYVPGLLLDGIQEWINQGLNARMRSLATPTALPFTGRDMVMIKGAAESDAAYAARLRRAFDDAFISGSPWSMIRQLKAYFTGSAIQVATVHGVSGTWYVSNAAGVETIYPARANWNWEGEPSTTWGRFWVIIWPESSGVAAVEGNWGDGSMWGDGGTWGTNITPQMAADVAQIVNNAVRGKPAGTMCPWIIWAFDPASFAPTGAAGPPLPDGHWESWGKNSGGVVVPSRLGTARYQDGGAPLTITES